jgi:uncharacterized protein
MSTPTTPLSEADFEQLDKLLSRISPDSMSMPELDGFFCALVCGPATEPLSEFIPEVLRMAPDATVRFSFVDPEELRALLERHWNMIAAKLMEDKPYIPFFVKDEEGNVDGQEWAEGFALGMHQHPAEWRRLSKNKEHWHLLAPVTAILAEGDPELAPEMKEHLPPPEERMELLAVVVASLIHIFRFFHRNPVNSKAKRK